MNNVNAIDDKTINDKAPAVFGFDKAPDRTDRYHFVSTAEIMDTFRENNWFPHTASQVKVQKRTINRKDFAKHLITFKNPDLPTVNGIFPQIAVINSHDGFHSLQMMAGLYRLICANGLVIADSEFNTIRIKHNRFAPERITEGIDSFIDLVPQIVGKTEEMNSIIMRPVDQYDYAEKVMKRVWVKDDSPFEPAQLIEARRKEDENPTLWNLYNRVQENLIKGGLKGKSKNGKTRKMRGVTNISKDIKINKILWEETEQFRLAA